MRCAGLGPAHGTTVGSHAVAALYLLLKAKPSYRKQAVAIGIGRRLSAMLSTESQEQRLEGRDGGAGGRLAGRCCL